MTELEKKAEEYAKSVFSGNDKSSAYYQQLLFSGFIKGYKQGQKDTMSYKDNYIKDLDGIIDTFKKENQWLKQKLQETECSPNCQWQKENEQLKWEQKQILEDNESYQKENEELKAQIKELTTLYENMKSLYLGS